MAIIADSKQLSTFFSVQGNRATLNFRAGSAKERCLLTVLIVAVYKLCLDFESDSLLIV